MDTVNAPVQKKHFPLAAVGFILLALTFIFQALSPLLTYVFNTHPAESFSLFDRFDIPLLLIQLFLIAFTLSLVCMLFIGKNNIVVFVCLLGMSLCYVGTAVRNLFNYIQTFKMYGELDAIPPRFLTSLITSLVSNAAITICGFLGFLILALAALFAFKGKKKLTLIWILAAVLFAVPLVISVLATISSAVSLFSDWEYLSYLIDKIIRNLAFPPLHSLNNLVYNVATGFISIAVNLLLVINSALLGLHFKKISQ